MALRDEWDNYINEIAGILATKEGYQLMLGEKANDVIDKFGTFALKDLAAEIKERHGISTSHKTLYNYAWVLRKTKDLHLPPDISFRVRQMIAGSEDPKHWADEVGRGMSSGEVAYHLRPVEQKDTVCPFCGKTIPHEKKNN